MPAPSPRPGRLLRRLLAAVLGAALLAPPADAQRAPLRRNPARTARTPNLVLIVADDLGWGDPGCYGQRKLATPEIDRLAAEGLRFTAAYAASPDPAASRASLLTGRDTGHSPVRDDAPPPLASDVVTLAEVVRAAGYRSAFVGAWGLGADGTTGHPLRQGFDEFFGWTDLREAGDPFPAWLWRNTAPFRLPGNQAAPRRDFGADWIARTATNAVRLWQDHPFLLVFNPPVPRAQRSAGTNGFDGLAAPTSVPPGGTSAEQGRAARLARLDAYVGAMLASLKAHRLDEDTVVLLTSHHGPARLPGLRAAETGTYGPWGTQPGPLSEGRLRVPLLARWPDHIRPGSVSHLPVTAADLLPTLAELAGAPQPRGLTGRSFAGTLRGEPGEPPPRPLYWETRQDGFRQALRLGPWKVHRNGPDQPLQLHHLVDDPAESRDVAGGHPEVVAQARELLERLPEPWTPPPRPPPGPAAPPASAPPAGTTPSR